MRWEILICSLCLVGSPELEGRYSSKVLSADPLDLSCTGTRRRWQAHSHIPGDHRLVVTGIRERDLLS